MRRAHLVGRLHGKPVYRVPVRVRVNDSHQLATVLDEWTDVLAFTPADAANYIRDAVSTVPETEVFAYGPKGGETYRYVGWYSAIASRMAEAHLAARQPALPF